MKTFLSRLLPLAFLLVLSAFRVTGQTIYTTLASDKLLSLMQDAGYKGSLDGDGDVIWDINGTKALVIRSSTGESLTFRCSFEKDENTTFTKINQWNATKRYSRSYLDKDNDPVISLDLDMAGGVTKARVLDFFLTCTASLKSWRSHVSGTSSGSSAATTPASGSTSSATTSGVTSGGVQYSTGVDMSAFGDPKIGCMAFYLSNNSFMYIVPVRGRRMDDKEKAARAAYAQSGLTERDYKYEWFAGQDASVLQAKFKNSMSVRILNEYKLP